MGLTRLRAEQISDIDYKQAVRVITVANVTLSGGAPTPVDGVNLSVGDRVLVTGQSTGSQNGIYQVETVGTGSNGTWIRSSDTNATGELEAGAIVMVTEGTVYADTQWKLTTDNPIVIGTTSLTFTQNYSANSISSGTSNVVVNSNAAVTISSSGTANVVSVGNTAVTFTGNVNPSANVTYTLGNTTNRWQDLWLANSSLYIGDVVVATTGSALTINGANVLTGNAGAEFSTSGNITGGNILTGGLVSATGNITGNFFIGNGSQLTGISAGSGTSISNGNSNVAVSANSNVTVAVTSTTIATFASTGLLVTGVVSGTGNITGNYFIGNGSQLTGISGSGGITWTTQANTAPVGADPGDFWYDSFTDIKYQYINDGTGNFWVDQSPPTSFSTLAVTGNITSGNLLTVGLVSATGNVTGGNILTNGIMAIGTSSPTDGKLVITGSGVTTAQGIRLTGDTADARFICESATIGAGILGTFSNHSMLFYTNSVSRMSIASTGNVSVVGSIIVNSGGNPTAIVNGGANGVGNIGSSTTYFNTVFAKATSAQYADLAENYLADFNYPPGTVVCFGGSCEITQSATSHSTKVAGVISTNPSYLMNSTLTGQHVLPVALTGRVPCRVVGRIYKGDRLVASDLPGVATVLDKSLYEPGCIIGKSLEDYDSDFDGIIEIAVGRY